MWFCSRLKIYTTLKKVFVINLDHQSDFDKQAMESKQTTSKDGGRFESGKDATIASGMYICVPGNCIV